MQEAEQQPGLPTSVFVDIHKVPWAPTPWPGIEMKLLYEGWAAGGAAALFRLAPGATFPKHEHTGLETTYVIEGNFNYGNGIACAGTFVAHPPGSIHEASSPDGALLIATATKPSRFFEK